MLFHCKKTIVKLSKKNSGTFIISSFHSQIFQNTTLLSMHVSRIYWKKKKATMQKTYKFVQKYSKYQVKIFHGNYDNLPANSAIFGIQFLPARPRLRLKPSKMVLSALSLYQSDLSRLLDMGEAKLSLYQRSRQVRLIQARCVEILSLAGSEVTGDPTKNHFWRL